MRDEVENWDVQLLRLKHSLQALAMPADIQLDLFPDFACKVEELALGFDHWGLCVLNNEGGKLSEEQKSLLRKLDRAFDGMSGRPNQDLWAEDALRNDPEWQEVRDIAGASLTSFGWPIERPPSYKHEYVRGTNI